MARQSTRRSLADVRTHTTRRSTPSLQKHELYMKLTSLEIERARRITDRNATLERVKLIDERLEAIVAEQQDVMRLLEQDTSGILATSPATRKQADSQRMNFKY